MKSETNYTQDSKYTDKQKERCWSTLISINAYKQAASKFSSEFKRIQLLEPLNVIYYKI